MCQTGSSANCAWEIDCDDEADCGSGVCCYDDSFTQSFCGQSTCTSSELQFCDPQASGECPTGTSCTGVFSQSGLARSYSYCQ
jgi:hypothetical protein